MSGLSVLKPEAVTWETAFRLFALRCKSQNLAQPTIDLYNVRLGLFWRWVKDSGNVPPAAIGTEELRQFIEHCRAKGNKSSTIDCVFKILRTFWRFMEREGLAVANPMAKLERPRREKRFLKPLTEDEFRRILEVIDTRTAFGQRDHALILFLADTGLRISEALAVLVGEVDWTSNSVTVLGKGGKERRVAFGQRARHALMLWMRRRGTAEPADFLWINRLGEGLKRNHFEHRFKAYCVKAGAAAERIGPHAIRHFFALAFLKNGGNAMALQRILGHETLDMTRRYCNMSDDSVLSAHRNGSPLDRMIMPLPNARRRAVLGGRQ